MDDKCRHYDAKVDAVQELIPIWQNGRQVNARVIKESILRCGLCGYVKHWTDVALAKDIWPLWKPPEKTN